MVKAQVCVRVVMPSKSRTTSEDGLGNGRLVVIRDPPSCKKIPGSLQFLAHFPAIHPHWRAPQWILGDRGPIVMPLAWRQVRRASNLGGSRSSRHGMVGLSSNWYYADSLDLECHS